MDLTGLSIMQIFTFGIVIIFIIAALALSIRFTIRGKRIKLKEGTIEEGGMCECSVSDKINAMYEMLSTLVETNNLQSSNITMLCRVQRPIIKTLRSHSYALKEAGANGSTEKALSHIDEAEDILNEGTIKTQKTAMSIGA